VAPYEKLKAWQHAHRLAVECGKAARGFPIHDRGVIADRLSEVTIEASKILWGLLRKVSQAAGGA
jgi:hypothetical protein